MVMVCLYEEWQFVKNLNQCISCNSRFNSSVIDNTPHASIYTSFEFANLYNHICSIRRESVPIRRGSNMRPHILYRTISVTHLSAYLMHLKKVVIFDTNLISVGCVLWLVKLFF